MERDFVLTTLRQHQKEIAGFGVKRLILFGSVARNEARENSDVDLLVEFNRPTGLFGLMDLEEYLENLLGCSVDLGTERSLKPILKDRVMKEAILVT